MPYPKCIALDLEGTLISNVDSVFPRPGLTTFLEWARDRFSHVCIYSAADPSKVRSSLELLARDRLCPYWTLSLPLIHPGRKKKCLVRIANTFGVHLEDVIAVDDMVQLFAHPDQHHLFWEIDTFNPSNKNDQCLKQLANKMALVYEDLAFSGDSLLDTGPVDLAQEVLGSARMADIRAMKEYEDVKEISPQICDTDEPTPIMLNVADLIESNGKSVRENNRLRDHRIPVGALVEIKYDEWHGNGACEKIHARLFVYEHTRDCDDTPLYTLTPNIDLSRYKASRGAQPDIRGHFSEQALTVVEMTDALIRGENALCWPDSEGM